MEEESNVDSTNGQQSNTNGSGRNRKQTHVFMHDTALVWREEEKSHREKET